jgi:hypothetical protein
MLDAICELTNVVAVWDFFVDGDGRRDGVAALADGSSG